MARFIVVAPQEGTGLDEESRLLVDTDTVPAKLVAVVTGSVAYPTAYDIVGLLNAAEEE